MPPQAGNLKYGGGWMNCTNANRIVITLYKVTTDAQGNETLTFIQSDTKNIGVGSSGTHEKTTGGLTSGASYRSKFQVLDTNGNQIIDDMSLTYICQ